MSLDTLFCQIIEAEYNATVTTIEALIGVPLLALRVLKGQIKRYEAVVLALVEGRLEVIEQMVAQMWNLILKQTPFDRFDVQNVCKLAYSCQALREHFFPPGDNTGNSDPSYIQFVSLDIRNSLRNFTDSSTYQNFDKYVCKLSFRQTLQGFVDSILAEIQIKLDELLELLGINNKIDEWIHAYMQASLPFLRKLQELDKFFTCAFGICNFAATALNKREDISERLLFESQGSGWTIRANELISSARLKENELRNRIDTLRIQLANPKFDSSGVKASDILKF